jgi:hypothetical protein
MKGLEYLLLNFFLVMLLNWTGIIPHSLRKKRFSPNKASF